MVIPLIPKLPSSKEKANASIFLDTVRVNLCPYMV